ncbi:hypothetical protein GF376_03115 [Candidatus Peregrinibacteria bacterium]|nr:hypothetical protein [Candidatus Peregrinibacteria bacterium]
MAREQLDKKFGFETLVSNMRASRELQKTLSDEDFELIEEQIKAGNMEVIYLIRRALQVDVEEPVINEKEIVKLFEKTLNKLN